LRTGGWEEYLELGGGSDRGVWGQLHNEYLHNLCAAQNIICVIQSQKLIELVKTDKWAI